MVNFYTFYSGSKGNCAFISDGDTNILVDAGVSASKIINSLKDIGASPDKIDAILITHEHSDHVSGVKVLSNKFNIPVYANESTFKCMRSAGTLPEKMVRIIKTDGSFSMRSANVYSFKTPHDSAESVGYIIEMDGKRYGVSTDTGCITKRMLSALARCEAVLIESNHDVEMLETGSYPYVLKKRILSDVGHLSNDDCAWLATQLAIWGTKRIALGHLSENNNTPEKAFETTERMFFENDIEIGGNVRLTVAEKSKICEI